MSHATESRRWESRSEGDDDESESNHGVVRLPPLRVLGVLSVQSAVGGAAVSIKVQFNHAAHLEARREGPAAVALVEALSELTLDAPCLVAASGRMDGRLVEVALMFDHGRKTWNIAQRLEPLEHAHVNHPEFLPRVVKTMIMRAHEKLTTVESEK